MSYTLLLIDDEAGVLRALQRVFAEEPYKILTALTPEEALDIIKDTKIDVILCDHQMPGMLGTDFLNYAKNTQPDAVRILVTGSADLKVAIDAINKGSIYYYFAKPWDNEEVLSVVAEAIEQKLQRTEQENMRGLLNNSKSELQEMSDRIESLGSLIESCAADKLSGGTQKKVPVLDDDTIILIDVSDIFYLATIDTHVAVLTKHGTYTSNDSLNIWEEKLGADCFFRCHRGYIVNINQIDRITPWFNGAFNIQLKGLPDNIPVSRNHAKKLKAMFGF